MGLRVQCLGLGFDPLAAFIPHVKSFRAPVKSAESPILSICRQTRFYSSQP